MASITWGIFSRRIADHGIDSDQWAEHRFMECGQLACSLCDALWCLVDAQSDRGHGGIVVCLEVAAMVEAH